MPKKPDQCPLLMLWPCGCKTYIFALFLISIKSTSFSSSRFFFAFSSWDVQRIWNGRDDQWSVVGDQQPCFASTRFAFASDQHDIRWSGWFGWSGPSFIVTARVLVVSFFPGHVAIVWFALWMVEMLSQEGGWAISRTVLPELTLVWFCPPWWLPPHYHPPSLSRPTTSPPRKTCSSSDCYLSNSPPLLLLSLSLSVPVFLFQLSLMLFYYYFHFPFFLSFNLLFCHFSHISKVCVLCLNHWLWNITSGASCDKKSENQCIKSPVTFFSCDFYKVNVDGDDGYDNEAGH